MKDFERIDILSTDFDALEKALFHELQKLWEEREKIKGHDFADNIHKIILGQIAVSIQRILMESTGYNKETGEFRRK